MGTTGFDSKVKWTVSMSSNENALVNHFFKTQTANLITL